MPESMWRAAILLAVVAIGLSMDWRLGRLEETLEAVAEMLGETREELLHGELGEEAEAGGGTGGGPPC